jgi:glycoside/pentoside/hexuronide:cation symporter, GPH family
MAESPDAPDSTSAAAPPPPSLWTKLAYGFGAGVSGVKDNGFAYFLLLFYSQVVGLDARLVGLALTIALMMDAIIDPVVGYWSDNARSRWGRRHPFMYAAAIPLASVYFLLWNPPVGWSDMATFWYLLGLAVVIRMTVSIYEIPSTALAPELSEDYDQRSSLMSFRLFFGWTVGNTMSVLMFAVLFPMFVTAEIKNGQFNRDAYQVYGIIGSVIMFVGIMGSALGTHSRIPYLKGPPPRRDLTVGKIFKEILETLSNRSFLSLFAAAAFGAVATGLSAALSFYFLNYFWQFSSQQNGFITMGVFGSAIIGALLAPIASRTIGKKKGAIIIGLIAFLGSPMPIVLRLLGVLPDNGDPFVFWFVFTCTLVDVGLIICFQILSASMMADLVEQSEIKTGRRSEGVFFAAVAFIRQMVNGLGLITATFVLTFAGIKAGADPSQVSPEAVQRLGMYYVPTILALWMTMIAIMSGYRITREGHEENLRTLAQNRAAE